MDAMPAGTLSPRGAPTRPFNPFTLDSVRPAGSGAVTGGGMPTMQPNQSPAKPSFGRKMNKGGAIKTKSGSVSKASSASSRADGCATKGKTKGRFV